MKVWTYKKGGKQHAYLSIERLEERVPSTPLEKLWDEWQDKLGTYDDLRTTEKIDWDTELKRVSDDEFLKLAGETITGVNLYDLDFDYLNCAIIVELGHRIATGRYKSKEVKMP